ncbi:hypothetical protein U1Q18_009445 [Sarracenia purpurea var. burkii]
MEKTGVASDWMRRRRRRAATGGGAMTGGAAAGGKERRWKSEASPEREAKMEGGFLKRKTIPLPVFSTTEERNYLRKSVKLLSGTNPLFR